MKTIAWLILAFLWGAAPPAAAAADQLAPGGRGTVKEVIDGDTVILTQPIDGATQVRLVGIQAPKLPLGRAGFRAQPLAAEAKAALAALASANRSSCATAGGARTATAGSSPTFSRLTAPGSRAPS